MGQIELSPDFEITPEALVAELVEGITKTNQTFFAVENTVIAEIIDGIITGKDIDGGLFPMLSDYTIAKKGHADPLIDKGLFIDDRTYEKTTAQDGETHIFVKPVSMNDMPRDQVAIHLQNEGTSEGKFFDFFGISDEAEEILMDLYGDAIDDAFGD